MSVMTDNPQIQTAHSLTIGFVVFSGVTMLDVTGPAEVFRTAARAGLDIQMVLIAAEPGEIATTSGFALAGARPLDPATVFDAVIVAGGDDLPTTFPAGLLDTARNAIGQIRRIASVCTGAFVLAELGLLDGRRATTHWRHASALARRYPRVDVTPDAIFVRDKNIITSAGVSAGIDLALALVEDEFGMEPTREIARELVLFLQRPGGQSQFSSGVESFVPRDSVLRKVTDTVLADPAGPHTVGSMAETASLSSRHLTRLFRAEFDTTPHAWLQLSRLQRAQQLLLQNLSVTEAARISGLGSDETLRRAMLRAIGLSPREFVRRFSSTLGSRSPTPAG